MLSTQLLVIPRFEDRMEGVGRSVFLTAPRRNSTLNQLNFRNWHDSPFDVQKNTRYILISVLVLILDKKDRSSNRNSMAWFWVSSPTVCQENPTVWFVPESSWLFKGSVFSLFNKSLRPFRPLPLSPPRFEFIMGPRFHFPPNHRGAFSTA